MSTMGSEPRSPAPEQEAQRDKASATIVEVGDRIGRLSIEIADVAGLVSDLDKLAKTQVEQAQRAMVAARRMEHSNHRLVASMKVAGMEASQSRLVLDERTKTIASAVEKSSTAMVVLSDQSFEFGRGLDRVEETLRNVKKASSAVEAIARETQMLAINAGVEAARAGDAGRGFAVIANSVKSLSSQIQKFSGETAANIQELGNTLTTLKQMAEGSATVARKALEDRTEVTRSTQDLRALVETVSKLIADIGAMNQPISENADTFALVQEELAELIDGVQQSHEKLERTAARSEAILQIAEESMRYIAQSGVETPDTVMIEHCRQAAARVAEAFEHGIRTQDIRIEDLFDTDYRPVANTKPEQFLTRFVAFSDRTLPPIQEPVLELDSRITACLAADRNGYIPTHNLRYSKKQSSDPVWNQANCRNRRIFNDRTGLAAARNTKPFLLLTYRRDMGGGRFVLVKEASAPIYVQGRHWGGMRLMYQP